MSQARAWRPGWLLLALAAGIPMLLLVWHLNWVPIALYALAERSAPAHAGPARLGLHRYRAAVQALPLAGVQANVSGLTFAADSGTLYAVVNRPPEILELGTDGQVLRRLPLPGLADTEGITHVAGDLFVVGEERARRLNWVRVPPPGETGAVHIEASLQLEGGGWRNFGLEGLSWDERRAELWMVNEKWPRQVRVARGVPFAQPKDMRQVDIREWAGPAGLSPLGSDLSSLSVHGQTGNLLLLSEESSVLVEVARSGEVLGTMPLWRGWHGLSRTVPQPEGIAMGPQGDIFVVSEPNLFFRFSPR